MSTKKFRVVFRYQTECIDISVPANCTFSEALSFAKKDSNVLKIISHADMIDPYYCDFLV